jgi:2-polyprenyl-3-methyl-5-hydroxy-6-metoxy-1,4-benzoquinol methylase
MGNKYDDPAKVREYIMMAYGEILHRPNPSERFYKTISDKISANLKNSSSRYLDVGCGVGRIVADIAKARPSSSIYGIDPSNEMIRWAKRIVHETDFELDGTHYQGFGLVNTHFRLSDARSLSIGKFDGVICVNVLDRVKNPLELLATLHDLTKLKGRLFLVNAFDYEPITPARNRVSQEEVDVYLSSLGFKLIHSSMTFLEKLTPHTNKTYQEVIAFYELR